MCGITGIINFNRCLSFENKNIKAMTDTLRHRGPDDEGYLFINENEEIILGGKDTPTSNSNFCDYFPIKVIEESKPIPSFLAFGHRRLSIIDLSCTGHEPMSYLNRYWIVYNGEIYNYLELRKELEKDGLKFRTNSDTEVILASYHNWGTACLNKFNGMWAFAIYDKKKQNIFIARDRFGIKPLHYYIDEHKLIFASEAKAFARNDYINLKPNLNYLKDFLISGPKAYIPETAFEKIYNFPAGHYIKKNIYELSKNKFTFTKYYDLKINPYKNSQYNINEYSEKYLELLEDAVRLRLRADVRIGTALSGGLDSSSIAYFVSKILSEQKAVEKLNAFSLIFNKNKETAYCDESYFIEKIVEQLNINSYTIEPNVDSVMEQYEKTVYHMDTPQESSLMSCIFTYKLVNEHKVKVTLDGQGGDELQAGYLHYLRNYFSNLPIKDLSNEYKLFNSVPGANSYIKIGSLTNLINIIGLKYPAKFLLEKMNYFSDPFLTVDEQLLLSHKNNLQNLLLFGDRSSMAFSVETRYPFMDYRMVEFWFNLPHVLKISNGWTKYLARVAMNNKLHPEIVWRKDKMGWEIPEKEWLNSEMKEYVKKIIVSSSFLQEVLSINKSKIIKEINYNKLNRKKLLKHFNLALWGRMFFN